MDTSQRRWVLKPLSPQLQKSDLRVLGTPSPDTHRVFHFESATFTHSTSFADVESRQDGDNTSDEWPSIASSTSSSRSGSQSGFYSFVDDPTSPEAELNEAWQVSSRRQAQLATLKEDSAFKLQTYAINRKPERLFADDDESKFSVELKSNTRVVEVEDEEKQLRAEIIRNQAPKRFSTEKKKFVQTSSLLPSTHKMIDGFSLTFSPVEARIRPTRPTEPGTINEDQINFSAARQQFLKLEQERSEALTTPPRSLKFKFSPQTKIKWREDVKHENTPERSWVKSPVKKSLSLEDLDSGLEELSLDTPGGYTSDDGVFSEKLSSDAPETPIQREIRLAEEREANLRRSRGLKHSSSLDIVEIKTKLVQSPLTPIKTRDKSRVSFVFQKEIQKESQRKDLPQPLRHIEPEEVRGTVGGSEESLPPCCPHRHPEESTVYTHRSSELQTPTLLSSSDLLAYQRGKTPLWRENQESSGLQPRRQGAPDFIEKEIEESLKREQELREQRESRASREEILWSPKPLVDPATEIDQLYLAGSDKPGGWSSPHPSLRQPSMSLVTPQPWTTGSSPPPTAPPPRLPPGPAGGLTETLLQDFEERRLKMKLDEGSYAGIQPVDEVNNQVVESTRVVRHKNVRALRWEAGVFNQEAP